MKKVAVKRSYTLGARAETARITREAIKAAAARAFAARPFDLVSLRDIAHEAQVTTQTVIRAFGSKEGLLATLADEALTQAYSSREVAERAGDVERVLRKYVGKYEAFADSAIAFFSAAERSMEIRRVAESARQYQLAWLERLFALYLPEGAGRPVARYVAQLYAVVDLHAWRALRRDCELSEDDAVDATVSSAMAVARSFH